MKNHLYHPSLRGKLVVFNLLFSSFFLPLKVNAQSPINNITTINTEEVHEIKPPAKVPPKEKKGVKVQSSRGIQLTILGTKLENVFLEPKPVILNRYEVPNGDGVCNSAKYTYMPYTAVTSKNSDQYKLLNGADAHTDETTGIRMIKDRYCIAVGTFYAKKIGTKLNVVMANGETLKCILGDVKSDRHTDETHRYQAVDGSVIEMVVDYNYFKSTKQYPSALHGEVERIEVVE